jgi:YVTN family beta-propeller protein
VSKARCCILLVGQLALAACGGPGTSSSGVVVASAVHSSSLALSSDGRSLFVVNPDADSVSVLDVQSRVLEREIPLGEQPPAANPTSGNFAPAVMPRSLALSPNGETLYVTGQRANALLVIDVASGRVQSSVALGSEPIGVVVSPGGDSVYVACSQDATVVRIDSKSLQVTATAHVANDPWALGLSADGSQLFVTHLLGPGVTEIDPRAMTSADLVEHPRSGAARRSAPGARPGEGHLRRALAPWNERAVGRACIARHRYRATRARLPVDRFSSSLDLP